MNVPFVIGSLIAEYATIQTHFCAITKCRREITFLQKDYIQLIENEKFLHAKDRQEYFCRECKIYTYIRQICKVPISSLTSLNIWSYWCSNCGEFICWNEACPQFSHLRVHLQTCGRCQNLRRNGKRRLQTVGRAMHIFAKIACMMNLWCVETNGYDDFNLNQIAVLPYAYLIAYTEYY